MTRRILNFLWPNITDKKNARLASRQGLIALASVILPSVSRNITLLLTGKGHIENVFFLALALPNILFFAAVALSIYFCSRIGAIFLLIGILYIDIMAFTMAFSGPTLKISSQSTLLGFAGFLALHLISYLFAINSVRGTIALHQMKNDKQLIRTGHDRFGDRNV